ncbi:MAG: hypothetical protein ACI9AR_000281 [Flavobacteriaceae bacterium]|jgi:hypothetical protein
MKKLLFTFLCIAIGVIQMNASVGDTTEYYFQSEIDSLEKEINLIKSKIANASIYSNCLINPAFTQDQNRQALQGDSVFLSENKDIDYGAFYRDFDLSKSYLISNNGGMPHEVIIFISDKRFAWELIVMSGVFFTFLFLYLRKRQKNQEDTFFFALVLFSWSLCFTVLLFNAFCVLLSLLVNLQLGFRFSLLFRW